MANFFRSFMSNLRVFPTVKAQEEEEELVDQQEHLRVRTTYLIKSEPQALKSTQIHEHLKANVDIFPPSFIFYRKNATKNHTLNTCWRNIKHATTVSILALKQLRPASKKSGTTCML